MDRRKALQLFGTASAVVATGSALAPFGGTGFMPEVDSNPPIGNNGVGPAKIGSGPSIDPAPFVGPGVESITGQALYSFPRDHAWHGGNFYQSNDFNEWHYITVLGRDLKTGERISIFWVPLSQGWIAAEGRPLHNVLFAFHNLDTGEFHTSMPYITGPLKTEGSAADAKNFFFRYAIDDGENGFTTDYRHATDTWKFSGYNTKDDKWNQPFRLDMTSVVEAPGYVPMAYWGLESIGVDPQQRQNAETMFGLSYYYTAPKMATKGKVQLKDRTVEFEGDGWFEHQWGNFRNTLQYRYFWAWFRFTNGDTMTFRQYYEGTDFQNPHYNVGRYLYMNSKFERSYGFGPACKVIPMKMWTSPKSGKSYPWYGRLETPQGTFYYEPTFPGQEGNALAGAYIEGVIQLRTGSPEGPIVATGFTEMISLTDRMPDGNDPSQGPKVTRGLPENQDGPWRPNASIYK